MQMGSKVKKLVEMKDRVKGAITGKSREVITSNSSNPKA